MWGSTLPIVGPFLKFVGYNPDTLWYSASVLCITQAQHPPPVLHLWDLGYEQTHQPQCLYQCSCHGVGYTFWTFLIQLQLGEQERAVDYGLNVLAGGARHRFFLPGSRQPWRWGFHSCNGFHDMAHKAQLGGIQPLWRDVHEVHRAEPLHVMVGGGDQLYNDPVWECPSMVQWVGHKPKKHAYSLPFDTQMQQEVFAFYFQAYMSHWQEAEFAQALAGIPQVMTWDDHDIFDGWGSYPTDLQTCPVFQGIFSIAQLFYCIYQHHSIPQRMREDTQVFGESGWCLTRQLGASTALLLLDTRSERTLHQVVSSNTWGQVRQRLQQLPASVQHLVVLAPVPLIYPEVPVLEAALTFFSSRSSSVLSMLAQKTGLAAGMLNRFGEPDLLDDLMDHWSGQAHRAEKLQLVYMMQELSCSRSIRVTFVSGDVHVAAAGCMSSRPVAAEDQDWRLMKQVISSAIGNAPPPPPVVAALQASYKPRVLDANTEEVMYRMFGSNNADVLLGKRNWCLVSSHPATPSQLTMQIRTEGGYQFGRMQVVTYNIPIPPLRLPGFHHPHPQGPQAYQQQHAAGAELAVAYATPPSSFTPALHPSSSFTAHSAASYSQPPQAYTLAPQPHAPPQAQPSSPHWAGYSSHSTSLGHSPRPASVGHYLGGYTYDTIPHYPAISPGGGSFSSTSPTSQHQPPAPGAPDGGLQQLAAGQSSYPVLPHLQPQPGPSPGALGTSSGGYPHIGP